MKQSCLNHPAKNPMIVIRQWQIQACDGNACAAALLSFFEYWHNIRLEQQKKASHANTTAENHGDPRSQDETLYQFHTESDLEEGVLIYKRDTIRAARKLLKEKGFIEEGLNPNPRYKFDRTIFFIFRADQINERINHYFPTSPKNRASAPENQPPRPETPSPSPENRGTIPETTTKTTTEDSLVASRTARSAALKIPKSFNDDWMPYFLSKKVWAGIDIAREKEKMEVWCELHHKVPTPRRLANWLNQADGESKAEQEPLSAQEMVVVEACVLKLPLTATQRKEVRDCTSFLREHKATTGQLKRFEAYWHRWDKPGERRDPPRPLQVCEKWSAFLEWLKKNPPPSDRAATKEICPRCADTRRVRSVPGGLDSPKIPCTVCRPQTAPAQQGGNLAA